MSRTITPDILCDLEDAVSVLQLFGSEKEISDTIRLAKSFAGSHPEAMDIGEFISSLRNSLRRELGLSRYDGPVAQLRLTLGGEDPRSIVSSRQSSKAGSV